VSPAEKRLRATLRARAWDFLSTPEAAEPPAGEIAVTVADDDREMVLVFRPRRADAPLPPALPFEPVQRYLPGMGLNAVEAAIIGILLAVARMTTAPLLDAVRKAVPGQVGEGPFKVYLARLTDPLVGVLDNDRRADPPGYGLTPEYRAFVGGGREAPQPVSAGTHTPAKTA
jgi:hypothetical protein